MHQAYRARLRPALFALACTAVLLPAPGFIDLAPGHGGKDHRVEVHLAPLPPELAGVRVEVHETVAPQVVLENATERTIEVLDPSGVPFLRIGREGVAGNLAARAWYRTYSPGAPLPDGRVIGAEPRWVRVRSEPSFGWFDPRLDASAVEVPHRVIDAGRPARVGEWTIPLLVDGRPVALAGFFGFEPSPRGVYRSRLASPSEIAPGVRVRLLPGPAAGLLVESASPRVLSVLDEEGEAFLRIGPDGVEANVASPAWRRTGRRMVTAPALGPTRAGWQRVATTPRFGWIEPRANPVGGGASSPPRAGESAPAREWVVPMMLGDEPLRVTGVAAWQPLETRPASAEDRR
jgi:hypothetical protein